jgi:hypothetical protein
MRISGEGAVMTTLTDVTSKKKPEPSGEEQLWLQAAADYRSSTSCCLCAAWQT